MKFKRALLSACLFGSVAAHAATVVSTSAGTFATAHAFCTFRAGGDGGPFGQIPQGTQYTLNISASSVVDAVTAVPEPASLALAGLDLFAAFATRKCV